MEAKVANEALVFQGVTKRFGAVQALDDVTFSVQRGTIHAVVGQNGAGKSTLMKILAGHTLADKGRFIVDGKETPLGSVSEARLHGIRMVAQEFNLFPHLRVYENLYTGEELSAALGVLLRNKMMAEGQVALSRLQSTVSPVDMVSALSVGQQQLVELARALIRQARLLVLDEPNSALSAEETEVLFSVLRNLRDQGVTVVLVSHRLEEVFAVADRITVLRDGICVGTVEVAQSGLDQVVGMMVGKTVDKERKGSVQALGPVVLEARQLRQAKGFGDTSFEAHQGELLGFVGLEGAGVDPLFRCIFGLSRASSGQLLLDGMPVQIKSPQDAIRLGIALVPASRREQGLFPTMSVADNIALVAAPRTSKRGVLTRKRYLATANEQIGALDIRTAGGGAEVQTLSGGNQQKVLVARWLAAKPRVLVLNDPTRGIDVSTRVEIHEIMRRLAKQGLTILFSSTDFSEMALVADRILVFYRGKLVGELSRDEATNEAVTQAVTSGKLSLSPVVG